MVMIDCDLTRETARTVFAQAVAKSTGVIQIHKICSLSSTPVT
jgi:hypothetical protein